MFTRSPVLSMIAFAHNIKIIPTIIAVIHNNLKFISTTRLNARNLYKVYNKRSNIFSLIKPSVSGA
jgi:hypothetical protein